MAPRPARVAAAGAAVVILAREASAAVPLRVVRSALNGGNAELLSELPALEMVPMSAPGPRALVVDSRVKYQEILGFGGAFTEAAAVNWRQLSQEDQAEFIKTYFSDPSEGGHGYTVGRVPINSVDFSVASYSFDDAPGDVSLEHFDSSVSHDEENGMLPMMRAAQEAVKARGQTLKLIATPWSPPGWMKLPENGQQGMTISATPNSLDPQYAPTWARYISKWISAYQQRGVDTWAMSVQNEPENKASWEGCVYTPDYMAEFVRDHLGPTLASEHPSVKIIAYDHNKDHVADWAQVLYGNPDTRKYLWGLGVHWYAGTHMDTLDATHKIAPEKFILATEAANCPGVAFRTEDLNTWWARAEVMATDIISDLRFWSVGWLDWNLALDITGGPNHMGPQSRCDAAVICDPSNSKGMGRIVKQASFYYIGHFSRFIPPGSRQIQRLNTAAPAPLLTAGDTKNGQLLGFHACTGAGVEFWHYQEEDGGLTVVGSGEAPTSDGFWHGGMCIDIINGDCDQGRLQIWQCFHGGNQKFSLRSVPAGLQIYNEMCGKCVTRVQVSDGSGDSGAYWIPKLEPCDGSASQVFPQRGPRHDSNSFFWMVGSTGEAQCLAPMIDQVPMFDAVAFETPQGENVVVVLNRNVYDVSFDLHDEVAGVGAQSVVSPARSMTTFTWQRPAFDAAESPEVAEDPSQTATAILEFAAFSGVGLLTLGAVQCMRHARRQECLMHRPARGSADTQPAQGSAEGRNQRGAGLLLESATGSA